MMSELNNKSCEMIADELYVNDKHPTDLLEYHSKIMKTVAKWTMSKRVLERRFCCLGHGLLIHI